VRLSATRGVIGVAVVVVAAGCGANSEGHTLSAGDLARITTVQPMTPGWAWPQQPIPPVAASPEETPSGKETPVPTEPDPLADALDRQIRDAGGLVAADGSRWQDEEKLGVTLAWLLKSSAGARIVLAAERAYQRGWVERTVDGGHFTDLPIEELGDEAWRIQSDFPGGQEVTFGWRRANLMLEVHIQCIFQTCPSDISLAARAWVDAIDNEAADAIHNKARTSP
jgi:hypothetical protein